jgi:hypothetical protein
LAEGDLAHGGVERVQGPACSAADYAVGCFQVLVQWCKIASFYVENVVPDFVGETYVAYSAFQGHGTSGYNVISDCLYYACAPQLANVVGTKAFARAVIVDALKQFRFAYVRQNQADSEPQSTDSFNVLWES